MAQWVGLNQLGSNRPERSLTRPPPRARVLTLISLSLWRPESPPPSPIYPRRPRPSPATRCCGSGSPFDGEPDGPRRSVVGAAVRSPSTRQYARPSASAAAVRWRGRGPSSRRLPCAWCSARCGGGRQAWLGQAWCRRAPARAALAAMTASATSSLVSSSPSLLLLLPHLFFV